MIAKMNSMKKMTMADYNKAMTPARNFIKGVTKPISDRINNSKLGKLVNPHLPLVKRKYKK
jgi:hypothetical protein